MNQNDEKSKIWYNGKFIDWWDAKIHVMCHVVHYGSSFFEGIRCYKTPKGPAILRLEDHIKRLFDSARIYYSDIPFPRETVVEACKEIIRINKMESAYIRPFAVRGYNTLGVDPMKCPLDLYIAVLDWGRYLGEEALEQGVDVCVSSWNRFSPNTMPSLAKTGGNYINSQLIKIEAMKRGFSEGIALDVNGFISEGSGENVFIVRDGKLFTPPPYGSSILPGLTRDMVIKICDTLGFEVVETPLQRELLYIADEIFLAGTAAEITPVRSIDSLVVGKGLRGPITEKVQKYFFDIIDLKVKDKFGWLTFVK
ncbi:branched-chain-amino-acid transaminase [candidate division KSB1 bacterium]|nr:branched-chain-amino-acid transaminase [candidate division KSB1 bacterium]